MSDVPATSEPSAAPERSADADVGEWPAVAVVIPVRNEAGHLEDAVAAVLKQDYAAPITICVAVGPSDDGTDAVAERLAAVHDNVQVVPNPTGRTPTGLNAAIRATSEPIVVRVDGHCELSPDYVRVAVSTLRATGAVNAGGIQRAVGHTPFERAVAAAVSSRFGTGGSRFRIGGEPGPVDTVYLGVFQRDAIEAVGLFDETLIRNQDYELNIRLRAAGGTVWFDPRLIVDYRPRPTLRALARQYFQYGQWKREVLRRHPGSMRARQALPPLACGAVVAGIAAFPLFRRSALLPATYGLFVTAAAAGATAMTVRERMYLAAIYPTMHFAWAAGLAVGPRRSSSGRTVPVPRW